MTEIPDWHYSKVFESLVEGNLPQGTVLADRYAIGPLLGKGGAGLVYRAQDQMLGEDVVLKILNPTLASDSDTVKRFKREIKICRKIGHPNVIRIYDIDEVYGTLFISMELVSGTNLKSAIRKRGRYSEIEGWPVIRGIVQGLAAAHRLGVIHRDLKSQNIMVDDQNQVKVLDFGMARFLEMENVTMQGDILGSPPYMSPEQAQGHALDHRTDIYSLGIILFEMFTGQVPFLGETPLATVLLQIDREPPKPRSLQPGLSADLEHCILTCLKKKPGDRFQDVEEILDFEPGSLAFPDGPACPNCGELNAMTAKFCDACGQRLNAIRPTSSTPVLPEALANLAAPSPFVASSQPRALSHAFSACLAGAVASAPRAPVSPEVHQMLELAAHLQADGDLASFRQSLAASDHLSQTLGLVLGLRHFTNRARMREATRQLLEKTSREELMMGYLLGEVLSLLTRQKSREQSSTVPLRSLADLMKDRLRKAFAEEWVVAGLATLGEPLDEGISQSLFQSRYAAQPALLALHLTFTSSLPASGGLVEILRALNTGGTSSERWRQTTGVIVGGLWTFWHGIESLPATWLKRQPATALAYDLGKALYAPG